MNRPAANGKTIRHTSGGVRTTRTKPHAITPSGDVPTSQLAREIHEGFVRFWSTRGGAPANTFNR
jgi:hypothetical protein